MRVTVCELGDDPNALARDWERLVAHVKSQQSELVLLPEMPFCSWFAGTPVFDESAWQSAVASHDAWQPRLKELAPAIVLGTRPVNSNGQRLNEGFSWSMETGYNIAHHKHYLPDEDDFWEASWFQPGDGSFIPLKCADAMVGFAVCTELWVTENSRLYGKEGVHIIVTPRATPKASLEKWLVAGRATALISGAFTMSSNHVNTGTDSLQMGGQGWIITPDGEVLGLTSHEQPFVTANIDLKAAELAKSTYPRYVLLK